MFNYWKNGSELYKRNTVFTNKNKNKTIIDFINMLKTNNKKELNVSFTWNQHFANISDWIGKTDYKNIIVIIYISRFCSCSVVRHIFLKKND